MKIKVGDLLCVIRKTSLGIGEDMNSNEYFYVGDLLLTVDNNASVGYSKDPHFRFISSKTGNSIYWRCRDFFDEGSSLFKKVEM
jgi:hypothetical protein